MVEADFDPCALASLSPPFFVRSLERQWHWNGKPEFSHHERVTVARSEVFPSADGWVSVWLIDTPQDFYRVALGINSGRMRLHEKLALLCMTPAELETAGLLYVFEAAQTACLHANQRHFNIKYEEEGILNLINLLIDAKRRHCPISEPKMKSVIKHASAEGCRATETTLPDCRCET
jgi:hypothetical protein